MYKEADYHYQTLVYTGKFDDYRKIGFNMILRYENE